MDDTREVEREVNHGQLDDDSSLALERLLEIARDTGVDISPGEVMGRALRLYLAVVTGRLIVTPSAELAEMAADAGLCEVPARH